MGPVALTPKAEEVMCKCWKRRFSSAPVLVFSDFDKPFLLETDASKEGLGAELTQKTRWWMLPPCSIWQQNIDTIWAELSQFQSGIPGIEVECHWSISKNTWLMCLGHGMYRQQSTHICAENTKFGCDRTLLGWSTHILWIHLGISERIRQCCCWHALSWVPVRHDKDTVWSLPGRSGDWHNRKGRSPRELIFGE